MSSSKSRLCCLPKGAGSFRREFWDQLLFSSSANLAQSGFASNGIHFFIFGVIWRYLALAPIGSAADSAGRPRVRWMLFWCSALASMSFVSFHADTVSPGRNAVKLYLHFFV
jgi:hypothetical protein